MISDLKPNLSKWEVARIELLKGVKVVVRGIKCIDLTNDAIKILGILFLYNKNIEPEQNFKKTRKKLTVEGKIKISIYQNLCF